jgi:hypothetical protein
MARFSFIVCPRCKQDALFVMQRRDTGQLYLHCEECEWAWNAPGDTDSVAKGFLGLELDGAYANEEQIKQAGWSVGGFKRDES